MKLGKPKTRDQLSRPPCGEKPPDGYPRTCFRSIDDPYFNGEVWFYKMITPFINKIYDVGADTTFYTNFHGEVHYFEPVDNSNIFQAESEIFKGNNILGNGKSYFNNYGLSETTSENLKITWEAGDVAPNPDGDNIELGDNVYMKTKRADEYMIENDHDYVDFVSVDVEGHELPVLKGFGDMLQKVGVVQFEHGGCTYSAGYKLSEIIKYLKQHGFWGFSYLDTTLFRNWYEIGSKAVYSKHRLVPLNWDDDCEDHYAYSNIVCVNENFLEPGKKLVKEFNGTHRRFEWPE